MYLWFWYFGGVGAGVVSILNQKEAIALAWFLGAEGHCACVCGCGNMMSLGSSVQQRDLSLSLFCSKSLDAKPDKVSLNLRT